MALTRRVNGSGGGTNIVSASWWNDYMDLLTGVMKDQEISSYGTVLLLCLGGPPASAPSGVASATGGSMAAGVYKYVVSFIAQNTQTNQSSKTAETTGSPTLTVTVPAGGTGSVALSSIPIGPAGTTHRRIYRTQVNGSTFYALTTLDNTVTTYNDTHADADLTLYSPVLWSTFGGAIQLADHNGTVQVVISGDGKAFLVQGMPALVDASGILNTPRVFKGSNTPVGPVEGDIWLKY